MKLKKLDRNIITMHRTSGLHHSYITPYNKIMSDKVYDSIVTILLSITLPDRAKDNIKNHIYIERRKNAL